MSGYEQPATSLAQPFGELEARVAALERRRPGRPDYGRWIGADGTASQGPCNVRWSAEVDSPPADAFYWDANHYEFHIVRRGLYLITAAFLTVYAGGGASQTSLDVNGDGYSRVAFMASDAVNPYQTHNHSHTIGLSDGDVLKFQLRNAPASIWTDPSFAHVEITRLGPL